MSMIKESAAGLTPIVMDWASAGIGFDRPLLRECLVSLMSGTHREIHISNPRVTTKDFSYNDHKKALMLGGSQ